MGANAGRGGNHAGPEHPEVDVHMHEAQRREHVNAAADAGIDSAADHK